jgi:hypothetical protein
LWCDELRNALGWLEPDCKDPRDGCRLTQSSYPGVRAGGGGRRLRSQITRDRAFIDALDDKLMAVGTITGAEVYELLLLRCTGVTS